MKPVLKWAGGKTSEFSIIKDNIPDSFENFVEPFLGGGAVYFNLEHKSSIVNDFNGELISFYKIINDPFIFPTFEKNIRKVECERNKVKNLIVDENFISNCEKIVDSDIYRKFLKRELNSKEKTICRINKEKIKEGKELLTLEEIETNKKTGVFAALYYMYRELYNQKNQSQSRYDVDHITYWFIMRELSYSGMFRFSSNGNFNVPYGGISYNSKNFLNKLNYILDLQKKDFYKNTDFNNMDFEKFFEKNNYFSENDFIFLDPPYDSEFSQYNKEEDFTKIDQERLRNILLKTKAKVMIVIKETEFIYDLYKDDFKINNFDKNYSVNFKNRNNRGVNHLLITNY
jgi:DNA adenine methylase